MANRPNIDSKLQNISQGYLGDGKLVVECCARFIGYRKSSTTKHSDKICVRGLDKFTFGSTRFSGSVFVNTVLETAAEHFKSLLYPNRKHKQRTTNKHKITTTIKANERFRKTQIQSLHKRTDHSRPLTQQSSTHRRERGKVRGKVRGNVPTNNELVEDAHYHKIKLNKTQQKM